MQDKPERLFVGIREPRTNSDARDEEPVLVTRRGGTEQEIDLELHPTRFNVDEVEEYLPLTASKYGLPVEPCRDAGETNCGLS